MFEDGAEDERAAPLEQQGLMPIETIEDLAIFPERAYPIREAENCGCIWVAPLAERLQAGGREPAFGLPIRSSQQVDNR